MGSAPTLAALPSANTDATSEASRLASLRDLGAFTAAPDHPDHPDHPDQDLHDLAVLASAIGATPTAVICLIGAQLHWIKAAVGWPSGGQTPRALTLCNEAIRHSTPYIVEDTQTDPRVRDLPFVRAAPSVRFYAAFQLCTTAGYNIGTLCLTDTVPRQLTLPQVHALSTLARQIMRVFDQRRLQGDMQLMTRHTEELTHLQTSELELALAKSIASEQAYSAIFALSPVGVLLLASDYRFAQVNKSFCEFLGYTPDELAPKTIFDVTHPDDQSRSKAALARLVEGSSTLEKFEQRYVHKSGATLTALVSTSSLKTAAAEKLSLLLMAQDVTRAHAVNAELKALQAKLLAAGKMAALGEMASGIAHEINNPLAFIKGKAELSLHQLQHGTTELEKLKGDLAAIIATTDRTSKIVTGLLSFARRGGSEPLQNTRISTLLAQTVELCLARLQHSDVLLKVNCPPNLHFLVKPTQICQILLNLLNNAYDAVLPLQTKWITIDVSGNEHAVKIRVYDSGPGIKAAVVAQMMEPFYTTKDVGKGTGLGLSISREIAAAHLGSLVYLAAEPNTCFELELPILEAGPANLSGDGA